MRYLWKRKRTGEWGNSGSFSRKFQEGSTETVEWRVQMAGDREDGQAWRVIYEMEFAS